MGQDLIKGGLMAENKKNKIFMTCERPSFSEYVLKI